MAQDSRSDNPPIRPSDSPPPQDLVSAFLRGQNLEQIKRIDEAVVLYERAVSAGFDAAGPYDRLIAIYQSKNDFTSVARVAQAALDHVRTFADKRSFYESMRDSASRQATQQPDARGPEF